MGTIKYLKIEIYPDLLDTGSRALHRARITVDTYTDRYELSEIITEDDFMCRFDWFLERAKREIADLATKPT